MVLALSLVAKSQSYSFRHYGVQNGLSNNTVTCSIEDKLGFMWFGTREGLNRFDGYSFKTFRKKNGDTSSIGSNYIHALYEDHDRKIWVGTENGMYQYIEEKEQFLLVPETKGVYVDKIVEDSAHNIWFLSTYKLIKLSRKTGNLQSYEPGDYFVATAICTDSHGTLCVGTIDGQLKKYHAETDNFTGFDLFSHSPAVESHWIQSLYLSASGSLIAGTVNQDIKLINTGNSSYSDITIPVAVTSNLYVRTILETEPQQLWIGTESGVFIYDLNTKIFEQLKKEYNNPFSISDNSIFSFTADKQGGVWVGTYFGGINYFPRQNTPFKRYYPKSGENSLSGNVISQLAKDQWGNLWIGTEDAGLNKLNLAQREFTHFPADGKPSNLSYFNIKSLLANGNELWVGNLVNGIDIIDMTSGRVVRKYSPGAKSGITHGYIYCIYKDHSGRILITNPHTVAAYNPGNDNFEQLPGLPFGVWYTSIIQDEKNNFWFTSFGNGVYYYDESNGTAKNYLNDQDDVNSIANNRVNYVFQDSHKQVWFATESGLCRWNEDRNNFTHYGTENGFPSDFILAIEEDKQQHLWISTTRGLVRFNPLSGEVKTYTESNGLIGDQFNYSSVLKDSGGTIYFGSIKGLISFNPNEFTESSSLAPVYFTEFRVNGMESVMEGVDAPLENSIVFTNNITLTHQQSTFSIDFAALNFSAPEMIHYSYRMEGLSDNWVTLKQNRTIDFLELPAGSYKLTVRAYNRNGEWSKETRMNIKILPPWWESTLAKILYTFLALGVAIWIIKSYHQRQEEKNRRKIELLEIEKEKEILEMELANEKDILNAKVEFFTNVAHEIRTPLTLIKVPFGRVVKKISGMQELENSVRIIDRNINRLVDITNQLLDFRQTEMHKYNLTIVRTDISAVLKEAESGFSTLAEQNHVTLKMKLPESSVYANVDTDAFTKIIYNLFSNAVKYAYSKVFIELFIPGDNENCFLIKVKNDGHLIPEELSQKIFEPFFRIRDREYHNTTGTGIGLALSRALAELHNGKLELEAPKDNMNIFSLQLPLQQVGEVQPIA